MPPEYFSTAMDDSEFDNSGDGAGDGDVAEVAARRHSGW
jgi:hypothetical protein